MGNYDFELDLESENTMSVIAGWITPGSEVLEFGPANGRLTKYLSEGKQCKVTIVEIDEESGNEAARYAAKSFLGEEYGNIEKYYWTELAEHFDYIIFADVLEHLSHPEKVLKVCKELLKEEGRILVSVPNISHNSVIIDLLKDEFQYDDTGLLDRTHIHFFTHKSFIRMTTECNLFICETIPIYSRVANNEIHNSYLDVPEEIASYLRTRTEGSIYQYVYNISGRQEHMAKGNDLLKPLEIEAYETLETQIFYKKSEEQSYSDDRRVEQLFRENDEVVIELDLSKMEKMQFLRWDPMECNGIVCLKNCMLVKGEKVHFLQSKNTNTRGKCRNLFIFTDSDPWIEFEKIPEEFSDGRLIIVFRILGKRRDITWMEETIQFLKNLGLAVEEQSVKNQNEYIGHLEKDLNEQKGYIGHLEKDLKEQKGYIEHLEKDIKEQQKYIEHLEKDIQELKQYLENNN